MLRAIVRGLTSIGTVQSVDNGEPERAVSPRSPSDSLPVAP